MFQDFHYCGLEPNNVIVNYDNRLEVQTCELDGLAEYVVSLRFCTRAIVLISHRAQPRYQHGIRAREVGGVRQ